MNITFRQLRLVLALADTGSVTGAARAMHITQPTASMQLRDVAEAVGLPLYDVIGKKVHLTEAGWMLARTARTMVTQWETFEQQADALKGLTRGKLRVAVVSTAKYFVPRMLGGFCATHPDIDIALEVLNRDGVVQRLRDNLDDLYIMSMPPTDVPLEDQVFLDNPIVLIAPQDHPLAKRRQVMLNQLANERFILREQGSGTRMAVDRHFKAQQFQPSLRLELGNNEAIKESVAAGLGLSMLSRHALHTDPELDGVAILKVQGFPIHSSWHVVYPKGKQLSPIAQVFHSHLMRKAKRWRDSPQLGRQAEGDTPSQRLKARRKLATSL